MAVEYTFPSSIYKCIHFFLECCFYLGITSQLGIKSPETSQVLYLSAGQRVALLQDDEQFRDICSHIYEMSRGISAFGLKD